MVFSDLPDGEPGSRTPRAAVEVGFHLSEIEPDQSLTAWQDLYHTDWQSDALGGSRIAERGEVLSPGWKGFLAIGSSPEGQFQIAEIPNGRLVWFIWSNCSEEELETYRHMVHSLRFGSAAPRDLKDAYGEDFQPVPLDASATVSSPMVPTGPDPGDPGPEGLGFRLPFTGFYLISSGPGCYDTHQGDSLEAIDYATPEGTPVKATFSGTVYSAKMEANGGNVIRVRHTGTGYVSAYMHLSQMNVGINATVTKGQVIGYSGNTGGLTTGPHLHFEVRFDGGATAWIRTLPTTTWYSGDPRYPCAERCYWWDGKEHCYNGEAVGP